MRSVFNHIRRYFSICTDLKMSSMKVPHLFLLAAGITAPKSWHCLIFWPWIFTLYQLFTTFNSTVLLCCEKWPFKISHTGTSWGERSYSSHVVMVFPAFSLGCRQVTLWSASQFMHTAMSEHQEHWGLLQVKVCILKRNWRQNGVRIRSWCVTEFVGFTQIHSLMSPLAENVFLMLLCKHQTHSFFHCSQGWLYSFFAW